MASSGGTERIDRVLRDAVGTGAVPGVVALASKGGEILYQGAHGLRSLRTGVPMTLDTVFWYASMTKALVAAGAMQLVERGRIELDEPIGRHVPELAEIKVMDGYDADGRLRLRDPKRPITLRHLLTHTSGFGSDNWSPEALRYIQENGLPSLLDARRKSLMQPLVVDPGERWEYGLSIDWAGQAIERISGQGLEDFLIENLFDPLGMTDTAWIMRPGRAERRADVHQRRPDGGLDPIHPHLVSQEPEFFMGGGGIYGTAGDYRAFLDMILAGGRAKDGTAVLKPETVALMSRNNIGEINVGTMVSVVPAASLDANFFPDMDQKWGLSFLINPEPGPHGRSAGSLAWAGLANSFYWADPATGICGIMMSQVLPFCDPGALKLFNDFERAVYDTSA
jgi:CubicO group peptidase (beta-lactamase class C family)